MLVQKRLLLSAHRDNKIKTVRNSQWPDDIRWKQKH